MTLFIILITFIAVFLVTFSKADRKLILGSSESIKVDDITRTFRVHETELTGEPVRIIIALHHLGGDGRQMAYYSALQNNLEKDTVLIYPDAIKPRSKNERPGWNADFCCGSGWVNKIDDKKFIETLINNSLEKYNAKYNKVLLTGFSNGAIFAHKLASELPDKVAGFAAVAGSIGVNDEQREPEAPVSALLVHGKNDQSIKIDGGISQGEPDFNWKSLSTTQKVWEKANKCSASETVEEINTQITTYKECEAKLVVRVNTTDTHQWPDWRLFNFWHRNSGGSKYILDFLYSI